jgi:hypothetical protein
MPQVRPHSHARFRPGLILDGMEGRSEFLESLESKHSVALHLHVNSDSGTAGAALPETSSLLSLHISSRRCF